MYDASCGMRPVGGSPAVRLEIHQDSKVLHMAGIEVDKSIRLCVDSGKVELGADKTGKLLRTGEPKLVILAANCPPDTAQEIRRYGELAGVQILDYPGTSVELGVVCGKPFPVSAMAVLSAGNSEIMQAVKKK